MDPSELAFAAQTAGDLEKEPSEDERSVGRGHGAHRRSKEGRKRPRSLLGLLVALWLLALIGLVATVKNFSGSDADSEELGFGMMTEDESLINDQYFACKTKVIGFLEGVAPENRAEFVLNSAEALKKMSGRQRKLSYPSSETEPSESILQVIETPRGKAIESVWEFDGGKKVEAVFFEDEQGEWKIDWENMVRYSDQDWAVFLAGGGSDEGEFRLLARRRAVEDSGKIASIVLIGPQVGAPGELGASSPEVPVDPDSRLGRVLAAAFAKRDAEEGIYGSQAFTMDPKGMIRLRVRMLREEDGERGFVIREILACHWYDFDDLGLER
ncbi:hypothetical protein [Haloferula sp.]|uniref:hypothetical protein n=1 Tax=Haloferula sp. TaxID=2497595 RepID=UPI003C7100F8